MTTTPKPTRRTVATGLVATGLAAAALAGRPAWAAPERIGFDGLYKSHGVLGLAFADRALALRDRDVAMSGYMAPPLKAESAFFVLTREPLAICPFCQSDADWPLDIVVVYLKESAALAPAGAPVTVTGRLQLGSWTDPGTGFVSQVRLVRAGTDA